MKEAVSASSVERPFSFYAAFLAREVRGLVERAARGGCLDFALAKGENTQRSFAKWSLYFDVVTYLSAEKSLTQRGLLGDDFCFA